MPAPYGTGTADRERIDHQWNGRSRGANPAITDADWHRVRVVHLPATGEIAAYVDRRRDPLMTAKDTTFGSGRVGFGSFDNVGRVRGLIVPAVTTGDRAADAASTARSAGYADDRRPRLGRQWVTRQKRRAVRVGPAGTAMMSR